MTTQAPPKTTARPATAPPVERHTEKLEAQPTERTMNSLPFLDHRARSRAVPARLARRGAYLAFGDGTETRLVPLADKITHIGRSIGSEVRFEDPRVSRSHAIIVRHGRFARVLDNRSSNGTFLNGRRVVATNLRNGDVIGIGPLAIQYIEVR